MFLYSTMLQIENFPIHYRVLSRDNGQFLLYMPELPLQHQANPPIFWVKKQEDVWTPVNIQDKSLFRQVIEDIQLHKKELEKLSR